MGAAEQLTAMVKLKVGIPDPPGGGAATCTADRRMHTYISATCLCGCFAWRVYFRGVTQNRGRCKQDVHASIPGFDAGQCLGRHTCWVGLPQQGIAVYAPCRHGLRIL